MRWWLRVLVVIGFASLPTVGSWATPAPAFPGGPWSPPVVGPIVRAFEPPSTPFGPGHLGVDFGVPPASAVRAAGDGVVVFAGRVGAGFHVVVLHPGAVRTTDSFLASIAVVVGQHVERGAVVGRSGGTGPQHAADVLHFGVRVGDEYIDPTLLFAAPDLGAIVHLAEPHGGSFGGPAEPAPPVAGGASEAAAIAAVDRVDARPPLTPPPPPWWSGAAAAHDVAPPAPAPGSAAATAAAGAAPVPRPAVHAQGGDRLAVASAFGTTAAAGGLASAGLAFGLRRRRRRRPREG